MPLLVMYTNPINTACLTSLNLRRLWDRREMIDDEVMNFTLGLLQLENIHVRRPGDASQWLFVNTFLSDKLCERWVTISVSLASVVPAPSALLKSSVCHLQGVVYLYSTAALDG